MSKADSHIKGSTIASELQEEKVEVSQKPDKEQVPPRLKTAMSDKDFSLLQDYIKKNDIDGFMKIYRDQCPELSDNDIISLALMRAVRTYDIFLPGKILDVLYKGDATSSYPLVTLDKNGKNAILYVLEQGTCIPQLSSYIFGLTNDGKAKEKFVLENDVLDKMVYILQHPKSETHPRVLIRELIEPIYTEESVKKLVEVIGEDWLDSYYI